MWFAKWFGGRKDRDDDEPARFAPVAPRSTAPAKRVQGPDKQGKSGFDPYNSGSFDKNQAWGKVLR